MIITEKRKSYLEILGIVGICVLLYLISNHSISILLKIFNQDKPVVSIVFLNRLLLWGGLLLFILYVKYFLEEKFLPWKERNLSVFKTILAIIVVLAVLFIGFIGLVLLIQLFDFSPTNVPEIEEIKSITLKNIPLMVFTCFTAAVLEEILFRGYMQPTFSKITNSVSLGIILNSILFGLIHISYGTVYQVIIPIFFGLVFSIFYAKYRNMKVLIICHFIWNLVVYLDSGGYLLD